MMLQSKTKLLFTFVISFLFASCSVIPKNHPTNKPFVYQTNIKLEGDFSKEEKKEMISRLNNQLDDSIKLNPTRKFFYNGFNRLVIENSPAYDSNNAARSAAYMKTLLDANGYLNNEINFDTSLIKKENANSIEQRTIVNFNVKPIQQVKFDSINFNLNHPFLQQLTIANSANSFLKKGAPFSRESISNELDRLVDIYRDNGFLKITRDELVAVWDTLDYSFLNPSINPIAQIALLEKMESKTPTANLEIQLRIINDSSKLKEYFVGLTTIYPDFSADTISINKKKNNYNSNFEFIFNELIFKQDFIAQNIFFQRGERYNKKLFLKTINRFNQLGAWKQVNIEQFFRNETDTVDFAIYLTPSEKYFFSANIEGSRNSNSNLIFDETLLGIGINAQLLNRNFNRSSNQVVTSIRYGTEVESKGEFVKSKQINLSHSIYFPKPVPNFKWIPTKYRDNFKTILSFSFSNLERTDFFNHTSLQAALGYNFSWKNKTFSFKLPNIEYALLTPKPGLDSIFTRTPTFRYIFNEGLVLSTQAAYQFRGGKGNSTHFFSTSIEESGLVSNLIKTKAFDSLFRFVKLDLEFIKKIVSHKNEFVFRTYIGASFAFKTRTRTENPNLPFFKQFYAGGPNSMRAWGVRQLGPGSTLKTRNDAPFRFGDFQFETNLEYRFPLTTFFNYPVSSCLFVDIGNVWFIKKHNDFPNGHLTANNFLKDLAVGAGTGLRIDFNYFRLRLDYAYKIKNPTPEPVNAAAQNKWFYQLNPFGGVMQLGINFPFNF